MSGSRVSPTRHGSSTPSTRSRSAATTASSPNRPTAESCLEVFTASCPDDAHLDTALTHAILRQVAAGTRGETIRLYRPDRIVVFSLLDARRPGFERALAAAEREGFASVLRLGGGHAALFHPGTLAFSWAIPDAEARAGIRERFEAISARVARILVGLGVDARVGRVPREYCPGDHSVNARGRVKLMGVGQRVIRGAAHVGGMVVVDDSRRVRRVLEPIYRALELDWDPATAGAVTDEIGPTTLDAVRDAFVAELRGSHAIRFGEIDAGLLEEARSLVPWHDPRADPKTLHGHGLAALSSKTLAAGATQDSSSNS